MCAHLYLVFGCQQKGVFNGFGIASVKSTGDITRADQRHKLCINSHQTIEVGFSDIAIQIYLHVFICKVK